MTHGAWQALLDRGLADVVGGRTAKALAKLQLHTVGDLLAHYPRRYAQRGQLSDLASLRVDEHVTVVARIEKVTSRTMRQRRGSILDVVVTDGVGRLTLTFFNQAWRERDLRVGRQGMFSGRVSAFRTQRQLAHPEYVLLPDDQQVDPEAAAAFAHALIPVYPASAAIPSWRIGACVDLVLPLLEALSDADVAAAETLPDELRIREDLPDLRTALMQVHRPDDRAAAERARTRLRWDEAFTLQAALVARRKTAAALPATPRRARPEGLLERFDRQLPYTLTEGQRAVGEEVAHDLAQPHPMHRLLQGDVGSGKTVVALRAMLTVIDGGGQAALLAPTEVLAVQHARTLEHLLGSLGQRDQLGGDADATGITLLTGSLSAPQRRRALLDIASGASGIVVGTHALLEERVEFADLGLVVVDEQHRFGVEQRAALAAKGRDGMRPHVLVMTATPIPRTVAMTVFGDLDVSTLTELPAGRAPITTHLVAALEQPRHVDRMWERIREEVSLGRGAYVVCPRIGGDVASDDLEEPVGEDGADQADESAEPRPPMAAALDVVESLRNGPLRGLSVDVLHGRMSPADKDQVMRRFADASAPDRVDVLVATTVIEVGIDVPRASVMVVLDADRFGISQLHQLRGRIGRGGLPGLCLLVTSAPTDSAAGERLAAVASTTDGFALAQVDLQQRREGDVLGQQQSGRRSSLRLLEVLLDEDLIRSAREQAEHTLAADPELTDLPGLRVRLELLAAAEQAEFLTKD